MKYRVVARAASRRRLDASLAVSVIERQSLAAVCRCAHLDSAERLQAVKEMLLRDAVAGVDAEITTLFVDEGLLASRDAILGRVRRATGVRAVKLESSDRLAGIQLADVYAGYCRERLAGSQHGR